MKRSFLAVWLSIAIAVSSAAQTQQKPNQESTPPPSPMQPEASQGSRQPPAAQASQAPEAEPAEVQPGAAEYDKTIFQNLIPAEQVEFLKRFDGAAASDVLRDKQFGKLMQRMIPDCMFHYGHDMFLLEAVDTVLQGSTEPARIRDGRYFMIAGRSGPYLLGRGFLWIDLQDGVFLGGFYFHPTNGEPTPAINIFSQQVKEEYLALSELPPAFAGDLAEWSQAFRVPPLATRYFINGANRKVLLEHDEDYCSPPALADRDCQQMNANAADIDMNAANYLEQTHHATNATAWMIPSKDQLVWLGVRDRTCVGPDLLPCRIRLTRERVRVIVGRPVGPHRPPIVRRPPAVSRSK